MPRIPDDQIAHLKQAVSLQRLVESEGLVLGNHGSDRVAPCPFHDDKTPSLVITPKTNLYHCFGCGAAGSVIDWVMQRRQVAFREAVEILQELVGQAPRKTVAEAKTDIPLAAKDETELLNRVTAFYHQTLRQSPEALAYLQKRGLDHPEVIDHFQLGYANRSLGQRLPPKQVKAGEEIRSRLQSVGILRDSGHEHLNGSLVIPVFDDCGDVAELYGRKIGERLRKGTPLHLYLPGPHRGIFNRQALAASKEIVLCESLIDALTFWCAGYRNVTCAFGAEGFTDELFHALTGHAVERVLIAFDRDDAGHRAAEKIAKRLMAAGIACFRVLFPKGMDANEYACQVKPATKSLGLVLRKAQWLGNGTAPALETAADPQLAGEPSDLPSLAAEPPPEPAQASPLPEPPDDGIVAEVTDHDITLTFGERRYRIRGLDKNVSHEHLKVNVLVGHASGGLHVDTLDLYNARLRTGFVRQAAVELGVAEDAIKTDLARVLLKLEQLQDAQIRAARQPETVTPMPSQAEKDEALALLKAPDLLDRIVADVARCGLVGEDANGLMGYLAAVSRKLDQPLAVIIQSTSAAGKSTLMDTLLALMPEEERVHYSAMTGQSLFYMGQTNLKHKILAIAEEEGVRQAAYALKLLQSQGELTIASTGKDEATGNLVTKEYRVEGPVMLLLTTTAVDIDEELMNRCVVLSVNESREQTGRIHARQRQARTLEGLRDRAEAEHIIAVHQNAQRLLRPLKVVNPYAEQLTFLDDKTRTRRDHQKYLALIDAIAFLHQHQREVKQLVTGHPSSSGRVIEYVEVTLDDITVANRLAHEVLGRSLDELPPQTRRLLNRIRTMVDNTCQSQAIHQRDLRFSRRQIREYTGWSDGQLKIHCRRLEDLEYLLVHRGGRGQSFVYELLYDGPKDEQRHLMGLIDPQTLSYDAQKAGQENGKAAPGQAQVRPLSGRSQASKNAIKTSRINGLEHNSETRPEKRPSSGSARVASYS